MIYQTTITRKGQLTVPKRIRDLLKLTPSRKVSVALSDNGSLATIHPAHDFVEVARRVKVKRRVDPLKARVRLETSYARS